MNVAPNFSSILDESPTEVKAPPLIPVGTYLARVGQYTTVTNPPNNMQPYIEFPFTIIAAGEDVDPDALDEIGDVRGKVLKRKYWITDDAAVFFDQLHQDCGIDLNEDKSSRRMRNDMIINAEVNIVVTHGQNQAGTRTFANVQRTLPVE